MKYDITAKRLAEALNDNRMSQQELSGRCGLSKASVSQYMNGAHCPSNISAAKMASVLNVNPVWLMGFDVEKHEGETRRDNLLSAFEKLSDKNKALAMAYIQGLLDSEGK